MSRRVLLFFLSLGAGIHLATAGLVLVQEAEQTGGPMPGKTTLTLKVSGEKARMDMGDMITSIVDFKAGKITSLLHAQKMAMELPASALESAKKAAGASEAKPDLQPTGKKETINGYACEKYTGKVQGYDVVYWITKDLPEQEAVLRPLEKLSGNAHPFQAALASGADFPGFPIRTIITTPQLGTSTVTVVSVKETDVPASDFVVPADYQAMPAPPFPPGAPGAGQ